MQCLDIFNLLYSPIILVKYDGTIYFSNTSANALFGYSSDALVGEKVEVLIPDAYCQRHIKVRQGYSEKPSMRAMSSDKKFTAIRKDKSTFPVTIGLSPISDGGTHLIAVTLADVSNIEKQAHLEKVKKIGEMTMGIAHNFNNYLAAIKGQVYMLKKAELEQGQIKRLNTIDSLCDQSGKMVKDLMLYGHADNVTKDKFDIIATLKEIEEIIMLSLKDDIKFQLITENIPLYIYGHQAQLEQVLLNIVNNALDALRNHKGNKEVVVSCLQCVSCADDICKLNESNPNMVCIKIVDTGSGIEKKNIEKIFTPFFSTKEWGKGTGLGLSTAAAAVEEHGGRLSVSSAPNEGTCFQFYLPILAHD